MANHASAIKRNRQRIARTTRNRSVKSALRSVLKRARAAALIVSRGAPVGGGSITNQRTFTLPASGESIDLASPRSRPSFGSSASPSASCQIS